MKKLLLAICVFYSSITFASIAYMETERPEDGEEHSIGATIIHRNNTYALYQDVSQAILIFEAFLIDPISISKALALKYYCSIVGVYVDCNFLIDSLTEQHCEVLSESATRRHIKCYQRLKILN